MSKHKSTAEKFDETKEQFDEIHDGLPESIASLDTYDVVATPFKTEWIIGSHVYANLVTRSGPLSRELQRAADEHDVPFTQREYVTIETADVDRVSTDRVRVPTDVFESIIEWYCKEREMTVAPSVDDE